MAKTIKVGKDGRVEMSNFKDILNIEQVVYYEVTPNKDETITLRFFDKNKKLVKPKPETL
jgi:hypothetical protein